jgi:uncharacterized glyoxalase superfamily protein PhnB
MCTTMCITIHSSFLPHDDPDASLAFDRDTLGFEVRNDVGCGGMRGIAVGPSDQPGTSIVLEPPAADPAITDDERRPIAEMMAKGATATSFLSTDDCQATYEELTARRVEYVQPPEERPYGRESGLRDPSGNDIRLTQNRVPATA